MSNDTDEARYTLAEARREMARQECRKRGHSWGFGPQRMCQEHPAVIQCDTCGWRGSITMDEKP